MAIEIVNASGANILPSIPCREAIGMKTTMMTSTPKTIGRTTSTDACRIEGAAVGCFGFSPPEKSNGVLHQNDGAVPEHADGDRETGQGHQIGGHARLAHHKEGRQRGHRQLHGNQQGRAQMTHEEEQHEKDQNRALKQRSLDRSEGRLYELVAIVKGYDLDIGRERPARKLELLFDPAHHILARAAAQHEHDSSDGLPFAVAADRALPDFGRDLDPGHLREQNRHTVAIGYDRILEVLRPAHPAVAADDELLAASLDVGAARDTVVGGHRR